MTVKSLENKSLPTNVTETTITFLMYLLELVIECKHLGVQRGHYSCKKVINEECHATKNINLRYVAYFVRVQSSNTSTRASERRSIDLSKKNV